VVETLGGDIKDSVETIPVLVVGEDILAGIPTKHHGLPQVYVCDLSSPWHQHLAEFKFSSLPPPPRHSIKVLFW
jgi:hypothetical protein